MVEVIFDPNTRWFGIANFDVEKEHRRRGIGKTLLREALNFANDLDARLIHAAIISREYLDAMTQVFGEETINVAELGGYEDDPQPNKSTRASLLYYPRE